jgi:hypothetical protein
MRWLADMDCLTSTFGRVSSLRAPRRIVGAGALQAAYLAYERANADLMQSLVVVRAADVWFQKAYAACTVAREALQKFSSGEK